MEITEKDEKLIGLLRVDGRLSVSEIARRLFSSRTAAQMRLQKLIRNGVIRGFSVKLSSKYEQSRVRALVMIKFPPPLRAGIEQALGGINQITSLYSISGGFDLAAVVSTGSMSELDEILDKIGCLDGIDETMSSIILATKIDR
ncbi:MAG: Lrp/AsnC family transcriptional regulator [Paracoccaceae bacterium]